MPAATESGPEQATDFGELSRAATADAAASPDGTEPSVPPALAEPAAEPQEDPELQEKVDDNIAATGDHPPLPGSIDVSVATDEQQAILDGLAGQRQPEPPLLDRVLARLAGAIGEPNAGYCSTSPEVRLSGEMAELNAKLLNAMAAEGVACRGQGDTLQFLLEQLGESVRRGF